jgi:hypothetical protein
LWSAGLEGLYQWLHPCQILGLRELASSVRNGEERKYGPMLNRFAVRSNLQNDAVPAILNSQLNAST